MNKENSRIFESERTEKCGEIMWIMWITWCITQFWLKNGGEEMWMQISWIMWITWISCESNIVFVQPDKFTIILQLCHLCIEEINFL